MRSEREVIKMQTLKVLSALLCYPQAEIARAGTDMKAVLERERLLTAAERAALRGLIDYLQATDLLDLQADYVGLFDRGRSLSLHLFEHVHGESRDRGQAMVDLMELYKRRGFDVATRELPDYIPLFLEYLAHRPPQEAGELLADAGHIMALLQARLMKRESPYQAVFAALTRLAGAEDELAALHAAAAAEPRDDTPEALDREWERTEEEVTFGGADAAPGACPQGAATGGEVPVQWQHRPSTTQPA
jgi:nitrate reductase delta subunit